MSSIFTQGYAMDSIVWKIAAKVYATTVPEAEIFGALSKLKSDFEQGEKAKKSPLHERMAAQEAYAVHAATTAALNELNEFWIPEIQTASERGQFILSSYDRTTHETDRYRVALQQLLGGRFVVKKVISHKRAPHTVVYW